MSKERIDILAIKQGLFPTQEKAKRAIMAGLIVASSSGERFDKPGEKIDSETLLRIKSDPLPYVSRGGLKLEKALKTFHLSLDQKIVLDIGTSTGGFTDVSLKNGALLVYALDVGTNQLDWKLRQDSRVVVMEKTNFRYSKPEDFTKGLPEIATIDVSFISLTLILNPLQKIIQSKGEVVALIKPQFESEKENVGKNGIIRNKKTHIDIIQKIFECATKSGFDVLDLTFSPIIGRKGNIEFLTHLQKSSKSGNVKEKISIQNVVRLAHEKETFDKLDPFKNQE
ncbi:MAG: TlyA family RNA methyltransferase [Lactobacillales bacterium]|nr:TlyA family RNA methyltransferase [Lactobacillales bacterium]